MRIAIVCSYYPWPPSVGGVETIVRNVAIELTKRGHEVHVVTTPFDVTTMRQVTDYGVEERDGVVIHKLRPGRIRIGYARVLKGLREVVEQIRPEIVHSHNLHPHLFQLVKWKKNLGYKLIAELHHPAINLDFYIQRLLLWSATRMLKLVSKNIDVFLAHTKIEKAWLEQQGIASSKIVVLPMQHINTSSLNYESLNPRDKHMILFLSRVVPKKGVHILIKALQSIKEHIPSAYLVVAGPEDPKYKEKLLKLTKELDLIDSVEFVGSVSEEEKVKLIASTRVFCLPTLADYHPIVLLEAQALGTPVVATRVGAIPEIVMDGETGILVDPNDPRELAKAIALLIEDEELWKRMSLRAREWAKNFVLEKRVDELEKLYHTILHG